MNNLKIGDTFEFALRYFRQEMHVTPVQCIVLKLNVKPQSNPWLCKECPWCNVMIGFESIGDISYITTFHQILVGNQKLIISALSWLPAMGCPESKAK